MPSVPKIGMRLIKTAVAVFLCFLVDFFRDGGTPFYSAIAAILCMQPELGSSLKVGKERIIATWHLNVMPFLLNLFWYVIWSSVLWLLF